MKGYTTEREWSSGAVALARSGLNKLSPRTGKNLQKIYNLFTQL